MTREHPAGMMIIPLRYTGCVGLVNFRKRMFFEKINWDGGAEDVLP